MSTAVAKAEGPFTEARVSESRRTVFTAEPNGSPQAVSPAARGSTTSAATAPKTARTGDLRGTMAKSEASGRPNARLTLSAPTRLRQAAAPLFRVDTPAAGPVRCSPAAPPPTPRAGRAGMSELDDALDRLRGHPGVEHVLVLGRDGLLIQHAGAGA